MLLELLALARRRTEQRAAGKDEVLAMLVVALLDKEILLLGAHGGGHARNVDAKQMKRAASLVRNCLHRAQKRGLLVKRLAGVAAKRGGDAQHLVFDERVAGGVPCGVAAGLEGGAQAARREARCVGFALDQLFARERHDGAAVVLRVDERVVLLGRDARQRLEPMGVVGGAVFDCPFLHGMCHNVGDVDIEGLALFDGLCQRLVGGAGKTLLHDVVVEDERAVLFVYSSHRDLLKCSSFACAFDKGSTPCLKTYARYVSRNFQLEEEPCNKKRCYLFETRKTILSRCERFRALGRPSAAVLARVVDRLASVRCCVMPPKASPAPIGCNFQCNEEQGAAGVLAALRSRGWAQVQ